MHTQCPAEQAFPPDVLCVLHAVNEAEQNGNYVQLAEAADGVGRVKGEDSREGSRGRGERHEHASVWCALVPVRPGGETVLRRNALPRGGWQGSLQYRWEVG